MRPRWPSICSPARLDRVPPGRGGGGRQDRPRGAIDVGVLDLYRRAPGALSATQMRDALSAADAATLILLGLRSDPGEEQAWDRSWGSRAEIHQATGMVVAQLGISAADALARLRAHAFAEQRLLGEVARDVVARRLRFTKDA